MYGWYRVAPDTGSKYPDLGASQMSDGGVQDVHVLAEEQVAPPPFVPQPAQVIDLDSESEDEEEEVEEDPEEEENPEEGLFLHELDEPLEADEQGDAINEMEEAIAQLAAMVQHLMDQKVDLTAQLETSENKNQSLETQLENMQIDYHVLQNARTASLLRQEETDRYVLHLRAELRDCKRRMALLNAEYTTSMQEVQEAIWTYPQEFGQFRHSISRARVIAITEDERVRAAGVGRAE